MKTAADFNLGKTVSGKDLVIVTPLELGFTEPVSLEDLRICLQSTDLKPLTKKLVAELCEECKGRTDDEKFFITLGPLVGSCGYNVMKMLYLATVPDGNREYRFRDDRDLTCHPELKCIEPGDNFVWTLG